MVRCSQMAYKKYSFILCNSVALQQILTDVRAPTLTPHYLFLTPLVIQNNEAGVELKMTTVSRLT